MILNDNCFVVPLQIWICELWAMDGSSDCFHLEYRSLTTGVSFKCIPTTLMAKSTVQGALASAPTLRKHVFQMSLMWKARFPAEPICSKSHKKPRKATAAEVGAWPTKTQDAQLQRCSLQSFLRVQRVRVFDSKNYIRMI